MLTNLPIVKDKLIADLQPLDSKLSFTATSNSTPASFPTLNINSLGEPQTEDDLDGTQNAIISTIELKGYSSKSLNSSERLIDKAGDVMISMGYGVTYGPATLNDISPYCTVARFRRTVADGDIGN